MELRIGQRVRFWNLNGTHRLVGKIEFIPDHGKAAWVAPEGRWQATWVNADRMEPANETDVCDPPHGRYGPSYVRLHGHPAQTHPPSTTDAA